jgi:hypothetical protein
VGRGFESHRAHESPGTFHFRSNKMNASLLIGQRASVSNDSDKRIPRLSSNTITDQQVVKTFSHSGVAPLSLGLTSAVIIARTAQTRNAVSMLNRPAKTPMTTGPVIVPTAMNT